MKNVHRCHVLVYLALPSAMFLCVLPPANGQELECGVAHWTGYPFNDDVVVPDNHSRHHIINQGRLRTFVNLYVLADNNGRPERVRAIIEGLADVYFQNNPRLGLFNTRQAILEGYDNGERVDFLEAFCPIIKWIPGNLVVGPNQGNGDNVRLFDPGEGYDFLARTVRHNILPFDNDPIATWIAGPPNDVHNAARFDLLVAMAEGPVASNLEVAAWRPNNAPDGCP